MKLDWNYKTNPHEGFEPAEYYGKLYDANGTKISAYVLRCDTETGECWIKVGFTDDKIVENCEIFPAPLLFVETKYVPT